MVGSGVSPVTFGGGAGLAFICGPCVIESREHTLAMARKIAACAAEAGVPLVFKSSYDKANRTSARGYRGVGIDEGLAILAEVREAAGVPVVSDVHDEEQARKAGKVLDLLQIPAFLCRQTSLLEAAGETGKPVMVKKGQFLHPEDMRFAVEKISQTGNMQVMLCERGACFGYRELVVDMRGLAIMAELGCPVVFDATHSVQLMGGGGGCSTGNRQYVSVLSRAAVAAGV
ncbi:MAG TPA: 3-deoxy-8-phosphooctulonate synthase, partial [Oligoflexia bacterium]|nr:3-deoxy-8-phosphooctulonate synthase [Oligoflexia bacterium]